MKKITITDIQKQVIDGEYNYLKPVFKEICDDIFEYKFDRNMRITDSDL